MKKRRHEVPEERRKDRVEINLLEEQESGHGPIAKARRGCTMPFSVVVLVLAGLEVLRSALG